MLSIMCLLGVVQNLEPQLERYRVRLYMPGHEHEVHVRVNQSSSPNALARGCAESGAAVGAVRGAPVYVRA
jgi:hypothetical protein